MALYTLNAAAAAIPSLMQMGQMGFNQVGNYFNAKREAEAAEAKANLRKIQLDRDTRDLKRKTASTLARQRALLAAGGQSGTAQSQALLENTTKISASSETRLKQDADFQIASFRAQATNARNSAYGTLLVGAAEMLFPGVGVPLAQSQQGFQFAGGNQGVGSYGQAGRSTPSGYSPNGTLLKGNNGMLGGGV